MSHTDLRRKGFGRWALIFVMAYASSRNCHKTKLPAGKIVKSCVNAMKRRESSSFDRRRFLADGNKGEVSFPEASFVLPVPR